MTYAVAAYLAWGLVPILWKFLVAVPAGELLAHRILWSFVAVVILLQVQGGGREAIAVLRAPRRRSVLLLSTLLISVNWLVFIWAVAASRLTEASLGYYINPLLNVLLGRVVLGEKLRPAQAVAVLFASIGVLNLTIANGELPWVSLLLASTFAFYGLVRKRAPVEPLAGLAVETGFVMPLALLWVAPLAWSGQWAYATLSWTEIALLASSGFATAFPLLWFAHAARRLRLATLGIVQYLAPTLQLGLAVVAYGEAFTFAHGVTFALIWSAVGIYAADAFLTQAKAARLSRARARSAVDS